MNNTTGKLLFTPGPLSTSEAVKHAMLRDLGSRDEEFIATVREIRSRLIALAGPSGADYDAVLMQGSGTFAVESTIGSAIPRDGRFLALVNGAYGRRMAEIAIRLGIETVVLRFEENEPVEAARVARVLREEGPFTHAGVIHCETTSGILNPIEKIGAVVRGAGVVYVVDAMSSFGGIPIDFARCGIDFLVSSANKCIQGVPGFAFVLAKKEHLLSCDGRARSLSLDLFDQWRGFETDGMFRYTPPIQSLLAFRIALQELKEEGGIAVRFARYSANHAALMEEMLAIGFEPFLHPEFRSPIIASFRNPPHPDFSFAKFYEALSRRGFIVYPGKLAAEEGFRIGTIGNIVPADIGRLANAIREVLPEIGVELQHES